MKSTAKAIALFRDIADKLNVRLGAGRVRAASDANGWPMLFVSVAGNEAESHSVIALRCSAVDAVSKDVFGNALTAFAPHALEVAYELDANGKPIPASADLIVCEREAILTGVKVQLKEIANGTAVTEAAMNAAAPVIELEDLYWPAKGV